MVVRGIYETGLGAFNDTAWIGTLNTSHVILNECEESALKYWVANKLI